MTLSTAAPKRVAAGLVALAAAAALAAPAHAAKKSDCPTASTTLVRKGHTRVYSVDAKRETATYGCWTKTGDRLRLDLRCDPNDGSTEGDDACHDEPGEIAINGPHIALEFRDFYNGEGGETYTSIVSANVRHPAREEATYLRNDGDGEISPFVERLFVSKRGGIAYSASNLQESSYDPDYQVVGKVTPSGHSHRLDRGRKLKAKSLEAHGHTLSWLNGGERRTAHWR